MFRLSFLVMLALAVLLALTSFATALPESSSDELLASPEVGGDDEGAANSKTAQGAQGFWGTTSGRNSGGGIKSSPSSSSSSSSSSVRGSSWANSGGRKGTKSGRKLQAALGMYPTLQAQKNAVKNTGSGTAGAGASDVAVSGFAAPRDPKTIAAAAPAPAAAKTTTNGRKLQAALGMYPTLQAQKNAVKNTGSGTAGAGASDVAVSGFAAPRDPKTIAAAAPAPAAAKTTTNGRKLQAALGMYPTLQAQKNAVKNTGSGTAGAGASDVAVSGFAAPRDPKTIAAAAPAPAAAKTTTNGRKLSSGFSAGFYGTTAKSSYSPSKSSSATTASSNNNRKVKAGRKLEAALGMYPTLQAQKNAVKNTGSGTAGAGASDVAVSGFAAPRKVSPAPAPAPAAKH